MNFAEALRALRESKKLTKAKVAKFLGISPTYYNAVESARMSPFPAQKVNYHTLASVLGAPQEELELMAIVQRGKIEIDTASVSDYALRKIFSIIKEDRDSKTVPSTVDVSTRDR